MKNILIAFAICLGFTSVTQAQYHGYSHNHHSGAHYHNYNYGYRYQAPTYYRFPAYRSYVLPYGYGPAYIPYGYQPYGPIFQDYRSLYNVPGFNW